MRHYVKNRTTALETNRTDEAVVYEKETENKEIAPEANRTADAIVSKEQSVFYEIAKIKEDESFFINIGNRIKFCENCIFLNKIGYTIPVPRSTCLKSIERAYGYMSRTYLNKENKYKLKYGKDEVSFVDEKGNKVKINDCTITDLLVEKAIDKDSRYSFYFEKNDKKQL